MFWISFYLSHILQKVFIRMSIKFIFSCKLHRESFRKDKPASIFNKKVKLKLKCKWWNNRFWHLRDYILNMTLTHNIFFLWYSRWKTLTSVKQTNKSIKQYIQSSKRPFENNWNPFLELGTYYLQTYSKYAGDIYPPWFSSSVTAYGGHLQNQQTKTQIIFLTDLPV